MNNEEEFNIAFSGISNLKPKHLNRLNFPELVYKNNQAEIDGTIKTLAYEDFDESDYFDLTVNDKKLIKSYQFITQYLLYSIKHLDRKKSILSELATQQHIHNDQADEILHKQKIKIKALHQKSQDLSHNTISFEYLVKHLNLDKIVRNLGKPDGLHESFREKNSVKSSNRNSLSAGEVECEVKVKEEKKKLNENELNFEEMHKINLDNSKEFKDKIEELRNN